MIPNTTVWIMGVVSTYEPIDVRVSKPGVGNTFSELCTVAELCSTSIYREMTTAAIQNRKVRNSETPVTPRSSKHTLLFLVQPPPDFKLKNNPALVFA